MRRRMLSALGAAALLLGVFGYTGGVPGPGVVCGAGGVVLPTPARDRW